MGNENINVGSDLSVFFVPEDTLLTVKKPTASHGLQALSATIGRPKEYAEARDRRNTRSVIQRIARRQPPVPWTINTLLRPSGAAGTAPDIGDLLKHAFGTQTISGGVSVTYSFLKNMTALSGSLWVGRSHIMEGCFGAVVQRLRLEWGGEFVLCTFSGIATGYIHTGYTTANGAGTSSTSLIVTNSKHFTKNAIIKIGSEDNSGAGFRVTAVNYSTHTLTLEAAATWSNGAVVQYFLPTGTFAGSPLGETVGSLSLDNGSTTINHVRGSVEVETGIDLLNIEFGKTEPSDVINPALRRARVEGDFLVKRENGHLIGGGLNQDQSDVLVTLGSTAGNRLKINANQTEFHPGDQDSPEEDMERFTYAGVALATSTGEDEMTLVLD